MLRRLSLLSIVFADTTFVFGMDFIARIMEFKIHSETYVSRSFYEKNIQEFEEGHKYRGQIVVVPEKESDLPKILLTKRVAHPNEVIVKTEMARLNQSMCRKCKGKGLTDWIEDIVEPSERWEDKCTNSEIELTHTMMLRSYTQFDFYNNVSALYRNRNFKKMYIQECKICQECYGVGFDDAFLESYVPTPIVENVFTAVQTHLELQCLYADAQEVETLRDPIAFEPPNGDPI
jgi:hypothetical protein